MRTTLGNFCDSEIPNLIEKLIRFVGRIDLERLIDKYRHAERTSGEIFKAHYLQKQHPWIPAFIEYFYLRRRGMAICNHISRNLLSLAGDSQKVVELQRSMPDSISATFKRNLLDMDNAKSFIFELDIASHFTQKGGTISWLEDDGSKHSEFKVTGLEFDFEVECKRVSLDVAKKVRSKEFFRFADLLLPEIASKNLAGSVDIQLTEELKANDEFINSLLKSALDVLKHGASRVTIPQGIVDYELDHANGLPFNMEDQREKLMQIKDPSSYAILFAGSNSPSPADCISLIVSSSRNSDILEAIKDRLTNARSQLSGKVPAIICCFLEGIDDFTVLANGSGLQMMTNSLFRRNSFRKVAAVLYSSDDRIIDSQYKVSLSNQNLVFENTNCTFSAARDYDWSAD